MPRKRRIVAAKRTPPTARKVRTKTPPKTPKKTTRKTPKKTGRPAARKKTRRRTRPGTFPVSQGKSHGDYDVGYGRPPQEYQFPPGVSGNPSGNTRHKTHLWSYLCEYIAMTPTDLARAGRRQKLSAARIIALHAVQYLRRATKLTGPAAKLLHELIERDEGKPPVRISFDRDEALTPAECDEVRALMRQRLDAAAERHRRAAIGRAPAP